MDSAEDLRQIARLAWQSVRIRETAALTRSLPAIGVVPIRVAGEDRIQVIALGPINEPPMVSMLVDPYRRNGEDLAEVGAYLEQLFRASPWQIWIPDAAAVRVLGLEGIRNRRNPSVSPDRQSLARFCWAVHMMLQRPGQQVVAVATRVLGQHLVTGQSPTEDAHLWARLAWDHPVAGQNPELAAASRRQRAGPTLVPFEDDEVIERIRTRAFAGTASSSDLERVEHLLDAAVRHSWNVLVEAHAVYRDLEISDLPGIAPLIQRSLQDFSWTLKVSPAFGASAEATAREFQLREYLHELVEDIDARGDRVQRELLRAQGRVIAAEVLRVRSASRKHRRPCRILLRVQQDLCRFRVGTALKSRDDRVEGRVEAIRHSATSTLFILRVTRGVRATSALRAGSVEDWFDTVIYPGPWLTRRRKDGAS